MLDKVLSREFLTTIIVIAAVVILALNDKLTTELIVALLGANGVYVWSRTRVKQTDGKPAEVHKHNHAHTSTHVDSKLLEE